jgi:LysM repeat protein
MTLGVLATVLGLGLAAAFPTHQASANNYGTVYCMPYGQTLSGVAAMYGTTVWALAQYNGITDPNCVAAGTCLTIPPASHGGYYTGHAAYHPAPPVAHGGYGKSGVYCVHYGDTLSGIAMRYGVSAWSIAQANGLANPNCIQAGMCLTIPGY